MSTDIIDSYKTQIRHAISDNNMQTLSLLLEQANYAQNDTLRDRFLYHIINEPYYFSFSSQLFDAELIEREYAKRAQPVIDIFSLSEQITLLNLSSLRDHKHIAFFTDLKWQEATPDLHQQSDFIELLGRLFHHEKFDILDLIIKKTGVELDKVKSKYTPLYYIEEFSRGASYFMVSTPFYIPIFDIINNYTEEKEAFLKKHELLLPTMEEADLFLSHYAQFLGDVRYGHAQTQLEKLPVAVESYKSHILYEHLQKTLRDNGQKKSRKI